MVELPELVKIHAKRTNVFDSGNGYVHFFKVINPDTGEETGQVYAIKAECINAFYQDKVYTFDISV